MRARRMSALRAIRRLPRWRLQITRHGAEFKRMQQRAVMQEVGALSLLRVAGDLAIVQRQVA